MANRKTIQSGIYNTLLSAPTRSGKGVSSVIPTYIVLDFKGENFKEFEKDKFSQGSIGKRDIENEIRKFVTIKTEKQDGLTIHDVGLREDFNDSDFEAYLKQRGLISRRLSDG
jgi:Lhr-like helicase